LLLLAIPCCLLASCAGGEAPGDAFTAEYRAFLAAREGDASPAVSESSGGYQFVSENGRLCVSNADGAEIWRSNDEWYVDAFSLGDVNRDRVLDVVFVVWKSYSFGAEHPARTANDDASVRCHLFVYSVKDDRVKPLWCSSNLPRPIYALEPAADGEKTPALSGMRLTTLEGAYTEDYGKTASSEYTYAWSAWGFVPETRSERLAGR
jgi:hypothetical protein